MKRDIRPINFNLIKLDQENVRFGGDIAQNQREAIELMLADPEDTKKILKLAEHIVRYGLDPTELQLVVPDNEGNYIVLEGNRRLTALKLLQRPDLCTQEKYYKDFLAAHNEIVGRFPSEIECSVVATREDGDVWIELKHTGQNGGAGRVPWDSDIRDERRARQTGVESIGRQIREIVRDNPQIFNEIIISDIYQIPVTTLTRLFASKRAQEAFAVFIKDRQVQFKYKLDISTPSIEFAIRMFRHEGYNVNDIRSDDDRRVFLSHIPPELSPDYLYQESLKTTGYPDGSSSGSESGGKQDASEGNLSGSEDNGATGGDPDKQKMGVGNGPKTKAKGSSKSRKYLVPWSLNIPNSRINEIYRELRALLEVERVPNATAITFRVFLEVSCDDYTKRMAHTGSGVYRHDNSKPLTEDDKLAIKIVSVAKHLESAGLITKQESKAVSRRAAGTQTVGSVDHLNQFVHSAASSPLPSELKDVAEEYLPMLKTIWP
ncbi:hypothetical protein ND440_02370 [Yersinia ruckeri]|uniref:hypothetical protein n=1 Tax=Yersinia ruckeri TaxID=29486 RepID=UPI0020BE8895|nr:hypothetical protein [Yersinia ruckeri]MCW6541003.1 hypothetical protein [Yersinia ruckeri]MCW6638291.1 hypothetical protein [Yersinia ruckeri]UZX65692.1 hypothetical protein ND440_02370 [Yersinia ruckeri]UZY11892.1 hypothetical protein LNQ46_002345 [Yersinia ruckeri]